MDETAYVKLVWTVKSKKSMLQKMTLFTLVAYLSTPLYFKVQLQDDANDKMNVENLKITKGISKYASS